MPPPNPRTLEFDVIQLTELIGQTIQAVQGAAQGSEEILLEMADGRVFQFDHDQDCCESVTVDEISGDINDIIGVPLVVAEERIHEDQDYEYGTWTWYTFRTIKGTVDIRWLGTSNGYYSEAVSYGWKEGVKVEPIMNEPTKKVEIVDGINVFDYLINDND